MESYTTIGLFIGIGWFIAMFLNAAIPTAKAYVNDEEVKRGLFTHGDMPLLWGLGVFLIGGLGSLMLIILWPLGLLALVIMGVLHELRMLKRLEKSRL